MNWFGPLPPFLVLSDKTARNMSIYGLGDIEIYFYFHRYDDFSSR